jgi:hypothetical protein
LCCSILRSRLGRSFSPVLHIEVLDAMFCRRRQLDGWIWPSLLSYTSEIEMAVKGMGVPLSLPQSLQSEKRRELGTQLWRMLSTWGRMWSCQ